MRFKNVLDVSLRPLGAAHSNVPPVLGRAAPDRHCSAGEVNPKP